MPDYFIARFKSQNLNTGIMHEVRGMHVARGNVTISHIGTLKTRRELYVTSPNPSHINLPSPMPPPYPYHHPLTQPSLHPTTHTPCIYINTPLTQHTLAQQLGRERVLEREKILEREESSREREARAGREETRR